MHWYHKSSWLLKRLQIGNVLLFWMKKETFFSKRTSIRERRLPNKKKKKDQTLQKLTSNLNPCTQQKPMYINQQETTRNINCHYEHKKMEGLHQKTSWFSKSSNCSWTSPYNRTWLVNHLYRIGIKVSPMCNEDEWCY